MESSCRKTDETLLDIEELVRQREFEYAKFRLENIARERDAILRNGR